MDSVSVGLLAPRGSARTIAVPRETTVNAPELGKIIGAAVGGQRLGQAGRLPGADGPVAALFVDANHSVCVG